MLCLIQISVASMDLLQTFVEEFSEKYHMFYRRVGMDRFYLFTDYTVLEQLIESKFSIIDQFREEAKNR